MFDSSKLYKTGGIILSYYKRVKCIKCGYEGQEKEIFDGCPKCSKAGMNVNFTTEYEFNEPKEAIKETFLSSKGKGMWKYKEFLPINRNTAPVTMGEGDTAIIHCKKLGQELGLDYLYIKNESTNPTWSYKDRLCSVGVAKAVQEKAPVITVSSTGNHGASAAAYAALAGVPCVIFTVSYVPDTMKTLMQSYGAYLIVLNKPIDRWTIMRKCVKEWGWYPLSGYVHNPIGSNPFAIDGYKTIAYEMFDELKELPDFISVPASYSDGLYGIWKGVKDLTEIGLSNKKPRMIAAEVFGSLATTFEQKANMPVAVKTAPTVSFSIRGGMGTYQGYTAIKESNGLAHTSSDEETKEMQLLLAKTEGIYAEAASVTNFVVIKKLVEEKKIARNEKVVAIVTSSGLKDVAMTANQLPTPPTINPVESELCEALKSAYGFLI